MRHPQIDQKQGLLGQPTAIELRQRRRRLGTGINGHRIGGLARGLLVGLRGGGIIAMESSSSNRRHARQTQRGGDRRHGHASPERSSQRREERLAGDHLGQFEGGEALRRQRRGGSRFRGCNLRLRSTIYGRLCNRGGAGALAQWAGGDFRAATQGAGRAALPLPTCPRRFPLQLPVQRAAPRRIDEFPFLAGVGGFSFAESLGSDGDGSSCGSHPSGGEIMTMLPHLGHSRISPMTSLFRTASRALQVVQKTRE